MIITFGMGLSIVTVISIPTILTFIRILPILIAILSHPAQARIMDSITQEWLRDWATHVQTANTRTLHTLPRETLRLKKGQAFELVFNIAAPGSTVVWEFSTLRNDIGFEVTIEGESVLPYRRSKCHVRVARGSLEAAAAGVRRQASARAHRPSGPAHECGAT